MNDSMNSPLSFIHRIMVVIIYGVYCTYWWNFTLSIQRIPWYKMICTYYLMENTPLGIGHWHQVVTCKCIEISICCLLDCDSRIIMSMTHSCPFSSAFVPPLSASYTRSTIDAFTTVACFLEGKQCTGPCLTTATWCSHKNFSQWECSFHWKLRCHWLEFLWQRQIAVVRQGPVALQGHHMSIEAS